MTGDEVAAFEQAIVAGGVALFPTDTVYGLACNPAAPSAVQRLYRLKDRTARRPAGVMWFDPELALAELPELGPRTRVAFERLLPGPVTLLLRNSRSRYLLASAADTETLGVRVPRLEGPLAPLAAVTIPVLQSSANVSGGADAKTLEEVPDAIRLGADCVLDGGELRGTSSTVVDLRAYEERGVWTIIREGAMSAGALTDTLG